MENIQESQNATVITENTKLMMRIAGVLFALLAVVQLINGFEWRNSGYCCLPRKTQKVGNHGISRNKAG